MASPGSLEVQCAIHCATETHLKTYFGLCEPFTVRSVGRKDKVLGSLRSWNAVRKAEALPGPKVQDRTHKAAGWEAPLGFEPRISCLQDRHFDQLSHGTLPSFEAAEGWFLNQIGCCCTGAPLHPVCVQFSGKKNHYTSRWCSRHHAKAPLGFEPRISCLRNRRFNQLSHGANLDSWTMGGRLKGSNHQGTSYRTA